MNANRGKWTLTGTVAVGALAVAWQWREKVLLRADYHRERGASEKFVAIHTERNSSAELAPISPQTVSADAPSEAILRARAELASLRAQAEAVEAARFAVGNAMSAATWRNAGGETPKAALETVLWAGAGGDVDALASMLGFIPGERARKSAQTLLEKLPAALRAQYDSPERLIAFLTIKDIPLGAVEVRQFTELTEGWPFPAAQTQVLLTAADGKQKQASLLFVNPGGGWKLLVTDPVMAHYAEQFAPAVRDK